MNLTSITTSEAAKQGFYPTPSELAEKLLDGIDWDYINHVLEPSAGKGDLVKSVISKAVSGKHHYSFDLHVDCVEIDQYLRSILEYEFCGQKENEIQDRLSELQRKESCRSLTLTPEERLEKAQKAQLEQELRKLRHLDCHIVHDDFLTFASRKQYNLIVMNPPFANGDLHLLKAIELQSRFGGEIRCILNAETIRNPYTNHRKLLNQKLEELGAQVDYIENGFSYGERPTDVTVALINISIPAVKEESDIFERLQKAAQLDMEDTPDITELSVNDFIGQIVSRFNVEVDAGLELIREYRNMIPYLQDSFSQEENCGYTTLTLCVGDTNYMSRGTVPDINKFLKLVRRKYWKVLFHNQKFVGKLTSNLREKYQNMVSEMANYDFTIFNIQKIIANMNAEMCQGVQETIISLFDKMTEEHTWYPETQKNIHYYNGWKTNQAHKIANKVILPVNGMFSDYSWSKETFDVGKAEHVISDIEKVFDYLDGNLSAPVNLMGVLKTACMEGQTRNIPCKYFDVTLYKKGTMHLKFRNPGLVDRFNIYCSRQKHWLPPDYGRKTYSKMASQEKAVVDSFHGDGTAGSGEGGYAEVLSKPGYFLAEPTSHSVALLGTTV